MPWKSIESEFAKKTGLPYEKNQLKHKWDWMRIRWSLWRALKGKETGLGWDHEKGTISASEDWWKKKIEENAAFKAFQNEGLEPELECKMDQLFGVSVAQGAFKFTPTERAKETTYVPSSPIYIPTPPDTSAFATNYENKTTISPSPSVYIPTLPTNPIDDVTYGYDDDVSENVGFNHNESTRDWQEVWNDSTKIPSLSPQRDDESNISGRKRSSENDVMESSKSRKTAYGKKGGAAVLMEKMDAMVKLVTERNAKDLELMTLEARTLDDSSHSLVDSLAKLVAMPELINGSPEFCFACTMVEDPNKRIVLNSMPDDHTRLQFIKYLFEKDG
ncbi:hypothetical protein M5689_020589 [Euphorbia peplus]|nr:hypothetical protein M5689_020589 [Euphorbia peplus]